MLSLYIRVKFVSPIGSSKVIVPDTFPPDINSPLCNFVSWSIVVNVYLLAVLVNFAF